MQEVDFMSDLHKNTSRDYLARVNDIDYPKYKAAKIAKNLTMIIEMETKEFVMEDINIFPKGRAELLQE